VNKIRLDKKRAVETFHSVFKYYFRYYKKQKEFLAVSRAVRLRKEEERQRELAYQEMLQRAATILKRAFWRMKCRKIQKMIRSVMKVRRNAEFSSNSQSICQQYFQEEARAGTIVNNNSGSLMNAGAAPEYVNNMKYRSPGIRQNSIQFASLLQQQTVFCDESFTAIDCVMLSNVLKNSYCNIQRLVLYKVRDGQSASYEFDLLAGISKCRSLRQVYVLGGIHSVGFLSGLHQQVSVENPRIKDIYIEGVNQPKDKEKDKIEYKTENNKIGVLSTELSNSMNRLLMDYFNYMLPGITTLSLHGCKLTNRETDCLLSGLSVNQSLKYLFLSLNAIEDKGFREIVEAVKNNKKSSVVMIDFSFNLIELNKESKALLQRYFDQRRGQETTTLKLILYWNIIYTPFESPLIREIPELEVLTHRKAESFGSSKGSPVNVRGALSRGGGEPPMTGGSGSSDGGSRSARHANKLSKVNAKSGFGFSSSNLGPNILTLRTESS
jgi:hypothetical protein